MPFAAGVFTLVAGNPVVTATTITSAWANNTMSDLASGLSTCVLKDGTQTITANIPMAGFKFTGLGAGSAAGQSVRYEQSFGTVALTDQATVTWNTATNPVATLTPTASRTMAAPTNLTAGGRYALIVTQDGVGGWSLTWNAVFKGMGGGTMSQPNPTAAAVTAFQFVSDGTNLYDISQAPFIDTNPLVVDDADTTKKLRFEIGGFTTANTRVITPPDANLTIPAITTKGDIVAATGAAILARLGVGADFTHLIADSTQTTGLSWTASLFSAITFTRNTATASGNVSYTGVGFTPKALLIIGAITATVNGSIGFMTGSTNYNLSTSTGGTWAIDSTICISINDAGGNVQKAVVLTLDSDGFTLTWTKIGTPSGTATFFCLAFR